MAEAKRKEPKQAKGGPSIERYARLRLPEIVAELRGLNDELKELVSTKTTPESPKSERTTSNNRWHYVRGRRDALRKEQAELRDLLSKTSTVSRGH